MLASFGSLGKLGIIKRSKIISVTSYIGSGDIVPGATAWYGLRAYNAAYATGLNKAVNVRRASDNATSDILILPNGNLDIATANTFATVDATAVASATASTTLNLTSASSTPHVGSTITGAGVVQPCYIVSVGSFTAGAGTVVVNAAQTLAAASISMQYALFVTKMYDQSGATHDIAQATAGNQPQLLPTAIGGKPSLAFSGSQFLSNSPDSVFSASTFTISLVAQRNTGFTTFQVLMTNGAANFEAEFEGTANKWSIFASARFDATASDSAAHAGQLVFSTTSSVINIDGSATAGSVGTTSTGVGVFVGERNGGGFPILGGYISEIGAWNSVAFSSGQQGSMHTNQSAYWGTP